MFYHQHKPLEIYANGLIQPRFKLKKKRPLSIGCFRFPYDLNSICTYECIYNMYYYRLTAKDNGGGLEHFIGMSFRSNDSGKRTHYLVFGKSVGERLLERISKCPCIYMNYEDTRPYLRVTT